MTSKIIFYYICILQIYLLRAKNTFIAELMDDNLCYVTVSIILPFYKTNSKLKMMIYIYIYLFICLFKGENY